MSSRFFLFAMSDPVMIAIVAGIVALLTAIVGGLNAVLLVLVNRSNKVGTANAENISKIEKATNSMKDALVAATAKASHAEGMEAQREKAKAEGKEI